MILPLISLWATAEDMSSSRVEVSCPCESSGFQSLCEARKGFCILLSVPKWVPLTSCVLCLTGFSTSVFWSLLMLVTFSLGFVFLGHNIECHLGFTLGVTSLLFPTSTCNQHHSGGGSGGLIKSVDPKEPCWVQIHPVWDQEQNTRLYCAHPILCKMGTILALTSRGLLWGLKETIPDKLSVSSPTPRGELVLFLWVNSAAVSLQSKPCSFFTSPHRLTDSSWTKAHSANRTLPMIPQERKWSGFLLLTSCTPLHSPPRHPQTSNSPFQGPSDLPSLALPPLYAAQP